MSDNAKTGFLLIHGFTGSHHEVLPLEQFFTKKGYVVDNITLPGHETTPEAHADIIWTEYIDFAQKRLNKMKTICSRCYVCGLSMGGAITHILGAKNPDLAGIIPMASPCGVPDWRISLLRILPFIQYFLKWHDNTSSGWEDLEAMKRHTHKYTRFHTRSVIQLDMLLQEMKRLLPVINVPVLILHSKKDQSVPWQHSEKILKLLKTDNKSIVWITRGGHIIPEDAGKEQMFKAIDNWLN